MTRQLSPAAQAVAKAALYVSSCDPDDYPYQAQEIAAAALRTVADYMTPHSDAYILGTAYCRSKLVDIAGELEAQ